MTFDNILDNLKVLKESFESYNNVKDNFWVGKSSSSATMRYDVTIGTKIDSIIDKINNLELAQERLVEIQSQKKLIYSYESAKSNVVSEQELKNLEDNINGAKRTIASLKQDISRLLSL